MNSLRTPTHSGFTIQIAMQVFYYQVFMRLTFSLLAGLCIGELDAATQ